MKEQVKVNDTGKRKRSQTVAKDKEPIDLAQIEADIMNVCRSPFRAELSRILGCQPDEESIQAFAKKHVDRFYQSVAIMGRLAGFSDKLEVEGNLSMKLKQMSNMELLAEQEKIRREIKEELRQELTEEIRQEMEREESNDTRRTQFIRRV
jgi:hypothetical protein